MQAKEMILSVLVVACMAGCSTEKRTCHGVAEAYATNLHQYMAEKEPKCRKKLSKLSSEFTMTIIEEADFDDYFIGADEFRYRFVRDSVSVDRRKVYVWYANDNHLPASRNAVKCIRLRLALRGWIVDLPLR